MSEGSPLAQLARAHGVATEYRDWKDNHVTVSDQTISAVLTALGVDVSDDAAVTEALRVAADGAWRQVLPTVVVVRKGTESWVPVHLPDGESLSARIELEDGAEQDVAQVDHWVDPREVDGVLIGEATVALAESLPLGYHHLVVRTGEDEHRTTVIITPARLALPAALRTDRAWGLQAQLYGVRSSRSWGIGDAADLAELGTWAARNGADFVLVNPVHAAEPVAPMEPSPYLPTTRRFVNPMYIRVEEVLEIGYLSAAEHQLVEWHGDDARRLNNLEQLDRDGCWAAKDAALRMLFRVPRTHRRVREFEQFCADEGEGLVDYATWCALVIDRGLPWQDWPKELQDPASGAVRAERERLATEVEFQCWLQWIAQRQLADAQAELRSAGMGVGVVADLAVGVHPSGADAWALGDVLARDISVGAPPDDYNQLGQDWSQPPWRPNRLAEQAYLPYREMIRTALSMSGGLRVDHILGLFRLWWVPRGESPTEGTYVRYDHEAMVGILALEAHRAGAVVIGEDLGTVEGWVRDYLAERGILGTSILWFERDADGAPLPPETYRQLCLASVTTHDLPPTAGYLQGEHISVRHSLDLLTQPLEEEIAQDDAQREAVLSVLRSRGLLAERSSIEDQVDALHRFLTWSPSKMLGVSVNDLAGDVRTINQPGTHDEYPNWRLPLADGQGRAVSLDQLMVSRRAKRLIRCVTQRER